MIIPDSRAPGQMLRLTGVTLPGLPSLVVGSNGDIAWGFTNTGGDWSDLVVIEPDSRQSGQCLTPTGAQAFSIFDESIAVQGYASIPFQSRWTVWGQCSARSQRPGSAQRWVAHDATLLAADITAPESARTVDEALAAAAGLGIPAQNFVVGDSAGRIGWTIAGPIPRRVGSMALARRRGRTGHAAGMDIFHATPFHRSWIPRRGECGRQMHPSSRAPCSGLSAREGAR